MFFNDPFGGPPIIFQLFFYAIFIIVIGGFAFVIVGGISTWMRNNRAPVMVEEVKVLSKRTKVYGGGETNARTAYYVTFGLERNGERVELQVSGRESGVLIEGDHGDLTYQGTRYQGFHRITKG